MELMAEPLFELANHAWTHGNLGIMPQEKALEQILWTQAEYERLRALVPQPSMKSVQQQLCLFRFPYGRMRPETLALVNDMGLRAIQWDVVGEQFNDAGQPEAATQLAAQIQPGSIVLLHANLVPKNTAALVGNLLVELDRQGFELVTVSELLRLGTARTAEEGYFTKPGDNLHLDTAFGLDGTGKL